VPRRRCRPRRVIDRGTRRRPARVRHPIDGILSCPRLRGVASGAMSVRFGAARRRLKDTWVPQSFRRRELTLLRSTVTRRLVHSDGIPRQRTYENVVPLLTGIPVHARRGLLAVTGGASGRGRYVSAAHLDNTKAPTLRRRGSSASTQICRCRSPRSCPHEGAAPRLRVQATNLLDNRRSFQRLQLQYSLVDGGGVMQAAGTRYYYPLATRSGS